MSSPPPWWSWSGFVASLVALGFATAVVLIAVTVFKEPGHLSPEESTLLSTVLGATIGAVATYLGTHAPNGNGNGKRPADEAETTTELPGE